MNKDHDILARIVALLLGLAMLAERAASRPTAVRLAVLSILLPARYAGLAMLGIPADDDDTQPPSTQDEDGTLLELAIVFRAMAALVMHACLTSGAPAPNSLRFAIALSLTSCVGGRRFLEWTVNDTS